MEYNTEPDKEIVRAYIHQYVNTGSSDLRLKAYGRTMQWLEGSTFQEIAQTDGASSQAVAASVKRVVEKVKVFALAYQSDYSNSMTDSKQGGEPGGENQS